MTASVIPADSTSYPTLAVIIAHDIQDGETKTAVWMLSEAIYRALRANLSPYADQVVFDRRNTLRERIGADFCEQVVDRLVANHRRSIETFTREHRERMEALSA